MTGPWKLKSVLIEAGVIVLCAALVTYLAIRVEPPNIEFISDHANYVAVLSALAGFFGTMLGFVIAVIIFLFGMAEVPAFAILRASRSYKSHWSIFKGALYSCFLATCLCVAALIAVWLSLTTMALNIAIISASVWVFIRLVLVVWVMKQMIDAEVRIGSQNRPSLLGKSD